MTSSTTCDKGYPKFQQPTLGDPDGAATHYYYPKRTLHNTPPCSVLKEYVLGKLTMLHGLHQLPSE